MPSASRTSRKKRKDARARNERARQRGLPQAELVPERPARGGAPTGAWTRPANAAGAATPQKGLPPLAKIAIGAVIALLVLWGLSFLRRG